MWRSLLVFVCSLVLGLDGRGVEAKFELGPNVLREKTLFEIGREIALEYPDVVLKALKEFSQTVASGKEADDLYRQMQNAISKRGDDCPICKAIAIYVAGLRDYPPLEDAIINVCVIVADTLGVKSDPLCPGVIKLQLPHIYEVLTTLTNPTLFCEYVNLCYPSTGITNSNTEATDSVSTNHRNPKAKNKTWKEKKNGRASANNVIKVVQLTDIHVEQNYAQGSETECGLPVCCLEKWGPGNANILGDYHCNIPPSTIELFLERVNDFQPDVVLFSGDIPPHTMWEETPQSQLSCTELLVETLQRNLSVKNVYPILGNHEMYPTNLFSQDHLNFTTDFVNNWKGLWGPLADFSSPVHPSGSYWVDLPSVPGLSVVGFNSNYMYTFNWYNSINHKRPIEPDKEADIMRNTLTSYLENAKNNGQKVILVGHHPPGGSDSIITGSRWFEQLVLEFSDTIVLMPTGHTHNDEFRLIYNSANESKAVVYVSGTMSGGGQKNPSMRIYYLNSTTYEVLDYDHYFLDLRVEKGKPLSVPTDWKDLIKKLYSAKEEYGLADLSPASWHNLTERFESDQELLRKHLMHSNSDAYSGVPVCGTNCKASHICRMRNCHFDKYNECVDQWPADSEENNNITFPIRGGPTSIAVHHHPAACWILTTIQAAAVCLWLLNLIP